MKHPVLKEAIFLLQEFRSHQCNTGGCVTKSLDQVIRNLKGLRSGCYSEPEISAMILQELGKLFSELPELKEYIEFLAKL